MAQDASTKGPAPEGDVSGERPDAAVRTAYTRGRLVKLVTPPSGVAAEGPAPKERSEGVRNLRKIAVTVRGDDLVTFSAAVAQHAGCEVPTTAGDLKRAIDSLEDNAEALQALLDEFGRHLPDPKEGGAPAPGPSRPEAGRSGQRETGRGRPNGEQDRARRSVSPAMLFAAINGARQGAVSKALRAVQAKGGEVGAAAEALFEKLQTLKTAAELTRSVDSPDLRAALAKQLNIQAREAKKSRLQLPTATVAELKDHLNAVDCSPGRLAGFLRAIAKGKMNNPHARAVRVRADEIVRDLPDRADEETLMFALGGEGLGRLRGILTKMIKRREEGGRDTDSTPAKTEERPPRSTRGGESLTTPLEGPLRAAGIGSGESAPDASSADAGPDAA